MKRLILFLAVAGLAAAQPRSLSGSSTTGAVDFGSAASTKSVKVGTSLPGSCNDGELYFKTDATSGQRLHGCESGSWVVQGGSGSSVSAKPIWITAASRSNVSPGLGSYQGLAVEDGAFLGTSKGSVKFTNSGSDSVTIDLYLFSTWDGTQPTLKFNFSADNQFPSNGTVLVTPGAYCAGIGEEWNGAPSYTSGSQGSVTLSNSGGKRASITLTIPTTAAGCSADDHLVVKLTRDAGGFTGDIHSPGALFTEVY